MSTLKSQASTYKPRNSVFKSVIRDYQLWILILPAIIYIAIFCYGPMYGIQLAFRDYDFSKGITGGNWAGLRYFNQYFGSQMFWPTLRNTFVLSAMSIILGFPLPILLALTINSIAGQKRKKLLQTTVYMPYFISTVVLVAILQIMLAPTSGILSVFCVTFILYQKMPIF